MTIRPKRLKVAKKLLPSRPTVHILGPTDHPDFEQVVAELHRKADAFDESNQTSPELVVLLVERPGAICDGEIAALRRKWPLAGFVAVAGTWCEGELRTGQPPAGMPRVYWYAFAPWWRRQLVLRARGLCPAWSDARFDASDVPVPTGISNRERSNTETGLIVLSTPHWETADALSDALTSAGYTTIWSPPYRGIDSLVLRGVVAGIWDGGQLDDREAADLNRFAHTLARDASPTIAILDFPRWEARTVARSQALAAGAAAVLGKPWLAADLLSETAQAIRGGRSTRTAPAITRAA